MNCEDLRNIKQLKDGMELVAGESGLDRPIRWIYFADCIQCLADDYNLAELIYGGELVIVTNESITGNEKKILDMIRVMNDKNVAGFIINEGQISQKISELCNELKLPLFELSVSLHLIDVSQILCKALVEEEINANSMERTLSTILFAEKFYTEDILEQAKYYGINLNRSHRIIIFQLKNLAEQMKSKGIRDEVYLHEIKINVIKYVKREFRSYGLRQLMILCQSETDIALVPADLFSRDLLEVILNNIIRKFEMNYQVNMQVGVGSTYKYINEMKKSYREAKNTLQISQMVAGNQKLHFYENLGIYSFISQVSNEKFLDDYMNSKLGALIEADRMQEGNLCETLDSYIEHNCNANAASEALFIHRNTMRYRLDKIKKILNNDLSDMSEFLELKLAFAIRRYRDSSEENPSATFVREAQ